VYVFLAITDPPFGFSDSFPSSPPPLFLEEVSLTDRSNAPRFSGAPSKFLASPPSNIQDGHFSSFRLSRFFFIRQDSATPLVPSRAFFVYLCCPDAVLPSFRGCNSCCSDQVPPPCLLLSRRGQAFRSSTLNRAHFWAFSVHLSSIAAKAAPTFSHDVSMRFSTNPELHYDGIFRPSSGLCLYECECFFPGLLSFPSLPGSL